jgi:hypothetical protein
MITLGYIFGSLVSGLIFIGIAGAAVYIYDLPISIPALFLAGLAWSFYTLGALVVFYSRKRES